MPNNTAHNLIALCCGFLAMLSVFILMSVFMQNTVHRVLLTGNFPFDTKVTVSNLDDNGNSAVLGHIDIQGSSKNQFVGTPILNSPVSKLRLVFNRSEPLRDNNRKFSLDSIQVPKPYSLDYYFSASRIGVDFDSGQIAAENTPIFEFPNELTGTVQITSKTEFGKPNYGLIIGLPLLFFFAVWFLVRNSAWRHIPAFSDMSLGHRISSADEFNTINGLRGLAAILVLLGHAAPGFEALQIGLALLFVLSGFLLAKPFVLSSTKIFSLVNIERYITKRLKRILPMYYFFIFITYVITYKFDTALRHFLFIQAEGHLWPMTQIFAFYMLLPLVLLITSASYRLSRFLPLAILTAGIIASVILMRGWMPFFNGEYHHPFFLYAFLMGVLAAYIQYDIIGTTYHKITDWNGPARLTLGLILIAFTMTVILWSAPMKPSIVIWQYLSQFWVKAALVTVIILLALNSPNTIYRTIIANPLFRSVGVIGFSFYILHSLGMQIFTQVQTNYLGVLNAGERGWTFTLGAFCITYMMALITYSYVERPFFGNREKNNEDKQQKSRR